MQVNLSNADYEKLTMGSGGLPGSDIGNVVHDALIILRNDFRKVCLQK